MRARRPCRLWKGAVNSDGYPVLKYKGRAELVTRIVLTAKLGRAIRPGHEAAHLCHRRHCVEATHLVEATHRQNCRMENPRRRKARRVA